jgi:hypothetical protein
MSQHNCWSFYLLFPRIYIADRTKTTAITIPNPGDGLEVDAGIVGSIVVCKGVAVSTVVFTGIMEAFPASTAISVAFVSFSFVSFTSGRLFVRFMAPNTNPAANKAVTHSD